MDTNETKMISFSLLERLELHEILPKKESRVVLVVLKDLKKKLELTQEEISKFQIKDTILPNGRNGISLNNDGVNYTKEIEITKLEKDVISSLFNKLDETKELPESLLNIDQQISSN